MSKFKLKPKHASDIELAIDLLNHTMEQVIKYIPDANYYIEDCGNFYTLSGDSHHDTHGQPAAEDRILRVDTLKGASGGGW